MKIDLYTKLALTAVAVLLTVNLSSNSSLIDTAEANQSGKYDHITAFGGSGGVEFFNHRTGEIFAYDLSSGEVIIKYRVKELGQALEKM